MKKLLLVVLALTMALGLAAAVSAQESLVVRDESDYIHMTMDELYQEALKEAEAGKTLVAYSNSGSVTKSVAKFMEDYPGIMAEGTKIKANAIEEKIPLEYEGSPYVDVIINSNDWGIERNSLGFILRRVCVGWIIDKDDLGKRTIPAKWAQPNQGGNTYGKLELYTFGGYKKFYVK